MNDHIKQIAMQADAWCDQHHHNDKFYDIRWEEMFAELIVRKCCEVIAAGKVGYTQVPSEVALDLTVKNLNAYFGVK